MKQVVWTYFATVELKNIYLYYKFAASAAIAEKIKKSILSSTNILLKNPQAGQIEENLLELKQGHRYIVEGNYKIIYRQISKEIYITDVFDCR
jgi:toxin ParE1/3/4